MYCVRKVTSDLVWVGGDDYRLALFEGVYQVPRGISYNSYLLLDEKTVLFDTVDQAVEQVFFENVDYVLAGRPLDYVVLQHMEPDHSATLRGLLLRHPEAVVVCNKKSEKLLRQFFPGDWNIQLVDEKTPLSAGRHTFRFVMAPMVHWPEVMMTYDETDGTLFSADAFGTFGALGGALFADEVNFERDHLAEARRYYCNIVGKYGPQVQTVLTKAGGLKLQRICPLHGFVWRRQLGDILEKYQAWSTYTPEEQGVLIVYASVYGNTANTAGLIAARLRERGIPTEVHDVSVTPAADLVAAAFRYSHMVLASTTYNAGIFVKMEDFLRDLAAHNIQKRTVALVENGSWAPTSKALMRKLLEGCRDMTFLDQSLTLRSSLKEEQLPQLEALVEAVAAGFPASQAVSNPSASGEETSAPGGVDPVALQKLSYGLFVLTVREGEKDNGCIINTAAQVTSSPQVISVTVNKQNHTHDMLLRTGEFNLSILTEQVPFDVFRRFGFQSGRDTDKFTESQEPRSANGIRYLPQWANALLSGKVIQTVDCGTHTLFLAEVTEAKALSQDASLTYAYYFAHIKPKPQPAPEKKTGFVCKICGYIYEGETLPEDYICPLCKHPASDFEPL